MAKGLPAAAAAAAADSSLMPFYYPITYHRRRVFGTDIERLLAVENLWRTRRPPTPLDLDAILGEAAAANGHDGTNGHVAAGAAAGQQQQNGGSAGGAHVFGGRRSAVLLRQHAAGPVNQLDGWHGVL